MMSIIIAEHLCVFPVGTQDKFGNVYIGAFPWDGNLTKEEVKELKNSDDVFHMFGSRTPTALCLHNYRTLQEKYGYFYLSSVATEVVKDIFTPVGLLKELEELQQELKNEL